MNCMQTIFTLIDYQQSFNTSSVLFLYLSKIESEESCVRRAEKLVSS